MLSRSQRMSVEQFNKVLEKGRVTHSPFFTVRTITTGEKSQYSAVISKKLSKKAVERNKNRRKIYEAIADMDDSLVSGNAVIIFAKNPVMEADLESTKIELEKIFVKAGLLK